MKLSELTSRGGFVHGDPVKRQITWVHVDQETGKPVSDVFDVWVIQPSYGMIDTALRDEKSDIKSANAAAIAACIRLGDDASEKMTYDQAYSLHPALALAMRDAINGAGVIPKKQNRSPQNKKSGTS